MAQGASRAVRRARSLAGPARPHLVPLEEKRVGAAVIAVDLELARPLLGRDHRQLGVEGADANDGVLGLVGARHGEHEVARRVQRGRDVREVEGVELRELLADALQDAVVNLPRLLHAALGRARRRLVGRQLGDDVLVARAPARRLVQLERELGEELHLAPRLRPLPHKLVDGAERRDHRAGRLLPKVATARLLDRLDPQLGQQDRHAHQLGRDQPRVLDQRVEAVPHRREDRLRGLLARERLRVVRGHSQRVDERLRVLERDAREQLLHEPAHLGLARVEPRDHLRDHRQPRAHRHAREAALERRDNVRVPAMPKPEREQAEQVLQRLAPAERNRAEEGDDRGHDVRREALALAPSRALRDVGRRA